MSSITDTPPQQSMVVVKTGEGSAGPSYADAVKANLPPLPRCEEHPRRELDLYCKLCQTAICSTCKEAEHSQCQKKWDENSVKGGIVFEGVERAARGLKEEVLTGLCKVSLFKERALREAAKMVAKRKTDIETQLIARKKEVDTAEQALIKAVSQRCNELRSTLEAAAVEKGAALEKQGAGLEKGAESLQGARQGAEDTLSSLVVEERPIEVVAACLKLKQELGAINQASQASAPVREANLQVVFSTSKALTDEVKRFGWSGALDVDVSKCTLSKQGDELWVEPGGSFEVILTTRDKLGQQFKEGGVNLKVAVEPEAMLDGQAAVKDIGDGTYVISFKAKKHGRGKVVAEKLSLTIEICGSPLRGSPFSLGLSPSSIVTKQQDLKALHGFLPGKKLELCYRASRDGWTAADFHRLCDGKGATLVVVKEAAKGYIFGGYTAVAWSSYNQNANNDSEAFLFSIRNPSAVPPLKIPYRAQYAAVLHNPSSGPAFGYHGDLALLVSGRSQGGSSQLCYDYAPPAGQSGYFLTGSNQFQLAEMEVFLVK